jgi:type II secretory pathway component PulM
MARAKLSRRERTVVSFGVVALLAIGLYFPVRRGLERYDQAKQQLQNARTRAMQAHELETALEAERMGQNAIREKLVKREGRFDLYSFTNQCLRELQLEGRANLSSQNVRGQFAGVQITLRGVSMQELVDLFYKIYAGDNLVVLQRVNHLRQARDGKGLECEVQFIAPRA